MQFESVELGMEQPDANIGFRNIQVLPKFKSAFQAHNKVPVST